MSQSIYAGFLLIVHSKYCTGNIQSTCQNESFICKSTIMILIVFEPNRRPFGDLVQSYWQYLIMFFMVVTLRSEKASYRLEIFLRLNRMSIAMFIRAS